MKKIMVFLLILSLVFLCGCYDASDVEETAYLIALGVDLANGEGYNYTFQFAAPLNISGGGEEGGGGGGSDEEETDASGIKDSGNKTVKNVVIGATDFYTAKNMLSNYLSKSLNMSHLKLIVCSEDFAKTSLKKHAELFLNERQIRPGTFVCISEGKAEQFLKAANPDLEGSTSKYYELSNSKKNLVYAPTVTLGDFLNNSGSFDKSAVLPVAIVNDKKSSAELSVKTDNGIMAKSAPERVSDSDAELYGMDIFKDSVFKGKMSGEEARLYNILLGSERRFTFSVFDEKNAGEILSFDTLVLKKPKITVSESKNALNISVMLYVNSEFIGAKLPKGYKAESEILAVAEQILSSELEKFLYKTSREFSADILKTERFYKTRFLTLNESEKAAFDKKYKNAGFSVEIKRSNKGGNTVSGEIN